MPRRSRRRLVPITTLIACALPCAGASAAPNTRVDLPLPGNEQRVEEAGQAQTLRALADRKQDRRDAAVRESRAGDGVVDVAKAQIGDGYAYGAGGPDAFDCSGLTAYIFGRRGVSLPHSSFGQAAMGRPVSRDDIRPGDLVFFSTAGSGASHVGIATGKTTAVSATNSGVMEHSTVDAYWGGHFVTARRL
ncbi:NlpC/P60 family protein [Solirubrobacter phytolaccae]|uniref:NlpC/P60 family protein n=1 Tax=Solirubrobacter phytolaccae TaxID=1404360 RepID=A0A9X3N5U7_9ACTN|nr:NlpC/P60 family protein [Solirubrobacter phytolaccae]MDA0178824.1 NlpC/P60 family protein [Solirubrobacter phytolaccae]